MANKRRSSNSSNKGSSKSSGGPKRGGKGGGKSSGGKGNRSSGGPKRGGSKRRGGTAISGGTAGSGGSSDRAPRSESTAERDTSDTMAPPARRSKRRRRSQSTVEPEVGMTLDIEIVDMAQGGIGLGFAGKTALFTPYVLPGEIVSAEIDSISGRSARALPTELKRASADRSKPPCPHFGIGRCWGCQWQHIDITAQPFIKQDVVVDQFQRFSRLPDAPMERALHPIVPAPRAWSYLSQMTFSRTDDGQWGLPRYDLRTSHPIDICLILHPDLLDIYQNLEIDYPSARQMQLIRGSDGATQVNFTLGDEDAPEITADFATSVNIILPDNEPVNLIGDSMVSYEIDDLTLRVTAGGAFRANIEQTASLVRGFRDLVPVTSADVVLDLYAGVGLFSAIVAPYVSGVTLVESYPPAVTDAETNLEAWDHIDIVEGNVEDVLPLLQAEYTLAIIDPPPRGITKAVYDTLLELRPARIVYLSSDPAQLGRFARDLFDAGYRLQHFMPFDIAPQTYYAEVLAVFTDGTTPREDEAAGKDTQASDDVEASL